MIRRGAQKAAQQKLSQSQLETIRYLHGKDPEYFSVPTLSRYFGVDYGQMDKITSSNTASVEQLQLRLKLKLTPLLLGVEPIKNPFDTIRQVETKLSQMLTAIERDSDNHCRLNRNPQHSFMAAALVQKKLSQKNIRI